VEWREIEGISRSLRLDRFGKHPKIKKNMVTLGFVKVLRRYKPNKKKNG
jgi:hypothetical protein